LSYSRSKQVATQNWSWIRDLNPQPADYKSAALPIELIQHPSVNLHQHVNAINRGLRTESQRKF
jgi:hypothetical protein